MDLIQNEIDDKLKDFSFQKLSLQDSEKIQYDIAKKFGINDSYTYPLWDNLKDKYSIYNRDGWKLISNFTKNETVFLILEQSDERAVYSFKNGEEVVRVLGECFGFVFYITNESKSYLLCFNDHDYLIGSGQAKEWIKSLSLT